jgi:hypothetical protein
MCYCLKLNLGSFCHLMMNDSRTRGCDVRMFTTGWAAPRRRSACRTADVAEAIAKLVAQPKSSRPARTVVGAAFGSDIVNERTAPVQAQVVETLGLNHLAKVA